MNNKNLETQHLQNFTFVRITSGRFLSVTCGLYINPFYLLSEITQGQDGGDKRDIDRGGVTSSLRQKRALA